MSGDDQRHHTTHTTHLLACSSRNRFRSASSGSSATSSLSISKPLRERRGVLGPVEKRLTNAV